MTVIVAGSRGLIGQHMVQFIMNTLLEEVIELDVALGHDLTDEAYVREFFASPQGQASSIVNLFAFNDHVAPGEKRGTLFDLPLQSFRDCLEVNLTSLFSVCREYARNNKHGNIVNFGASTGVVSARPDMYDGAHKHVGYSVSKAGVAHLTRILAVHLAPDIRVNCIVPGGISHDQPIEFKNLYGSYAPMGRMASLKDLEPAMRMLLSPDNRYMTGAEIIIDGGWTII